MTMNTLPWGTIISVAAPFIIVLFLKLLLDLRVAQLIVKYLYWIPLRNYFREKPIKLGGTWEHLWGAGGSDTFNSEIDRHSHCKIRQLGSYVYAEFYSKSILYAFFGEIKHDFVIGEWYDLNDPIGYYGAIHLKIVDSSHLNGMWLGHSKTNMVIRTDYSNWNKIEE